MKLSLQRVRQMSTFAAAAGALLTLAGCQSFATASSAVRFRVIDLSPDAGSVDIYQGAHALAYNLTYGAVTSYVPLTPGTYTTMVVVAGGKQMLSTSRETLAAGTQYTLLINSAAASLRQTILTDQPALGAVPLGIRLIQQAERTGAVDLYLVPAGQRLASLKPVATNLAPGVSTGYLPVPPGIYAAVVLPAGAAPVASQAIHTGRLVEYATGSAHTLILLDAAPNLAHRLELIQTVDGEPTS